MAHVFGSLLRQNFRKKEYMRKQQVLHLGVFQQQNQDSTKR